MKNKRLPISLIIISTVLVILNLITAENGYFEKGLWLRISSSVLLIIAMIIVLRKRKEN